MRGARGLISLARTPAAILLVLILAGSALAAKRFMFFSEDREKAVFDLAAAVPKDALYFKEYEDTPFTQSYYYQFDSREGWDFYCHLFFADMGFGLKRFGMDYKLRYADGRTTYFGTKYDPEDGSQAGDRFDFKVGPNRVSGNRTSHRLEIDDGPVKVDVTFKIEVPLYRVGEGKMCIGDDCKKHGSIVYFPLFTATGTVRDGSTPLEVSGWGYGNQVKQNFMLTDMSKFHTALRWHRDGLGFDVHDYVTPPELGGEWLPVLMVHQDGKMIHVSQNYKKENLEYYDEPRSGKRIPTSYRVTSEGKDLKVEIEFLDVKLGDYNDPLLFLGPVEKYLLSFIAEAPLDLRFDGYVKIKLVTPAGTIVKEGPGHGLALLAQ